MDEKFLTGIAGILEYKSHSISETTDLGHWGSLEIIATIDLIDEVYNVTVPVKSLTECKTVGEILSLIKREL